MYNDVLTTCFGRFLTDHQQVGIQRQRNYVPTISKDISISIDQYCSPVVLIYTTRMTFLKEDDLTDGYFCLTKLDVHN